MPASGDHQAGRGTSPAGPAATADDRGRHGPAITRLPVSREAGRQLLYLLAGGLPALLYLGLATVVTSSAGLTSQGQIIALAAIPLAFLLAVAAGLTGPVRDLEAAITRTLLGTQTGQRASSRVRSAWWHVIHVSAGGLAGTMLATIPVVAVIASLASWGAGPAGAGGLPGWSLALGRWTPAAGAVTVLLVLGAVWALGAGLRELAPRLLGPSAADQLAAAQLRARQLAGRNRVARELHDSIGHSLSVVSIQAAAAQRLLTADPAFADRALSSVTETARRALQDLDYVLGILREPGDPGGSGEPIVPRVPAESRKTTEGARPHDDAGVADDAGDAGDAEDAGDAGNAGAATMAATLTDLGELISRVEQAGVSIAADTTADSGRLPVAVSREAYRIVQEGLTNVLRHGGTDAATLRIYADSDRLRIEIVNALGRLPGQDGRSGGRGLAGIAERTAVLGGRMSAGPAGGSWRLEVELPLRATP